MFLWVTPTELRLRNVITPGFTGGYSQGTPMELGTVGYSQATPMELGTVGYS